MEMKKLRDKEGNYDFVYDEQDYANILENKLGVDYKNYFLDINSKADYNKAKVNSDLESYEMQLESNMCIAQDTLEIIEILYDELDKKRLDRSKILEKLNSIEEKLVNLI